MTTAPQCSRKQSQQPSGSPVTQYPSRFQTIAVAVLPRPRRVDSVARSGVHPNLRSYAAVRPVLSTTGRSSMPASASVNSPKETRAPEINPGLGRIKEARDVYERAARNGESGDVISQKCRSQVEPAGAEAGSRIELAGVYS